MSPPSPRAFLGFKPEESGEEDTSNQPERRKRTMAFQLTLIAALLVLAYVVVPKLYSRLLRAAVSECGDRDFGAAAPTGSMVALRLLVKQGLTCEIVTINCGGRVLQDAFDHSRNRLWFTPHTRNRSTLLAYAAAAHEVAHAARHHRGVKGLLNLIVNSAISRCLFDITIMVGVAAMCGEIVFRFVAGDLASIAPIGHIALAIVAAMTAIGIFIEADANQWALQAIGAPSEETTKIRRLFFACAISRITNLILWASPITLLGGVAHLC
jgi:Zn-dependent membrane protease YugP